MNWIPLVSIILATASAAAPSTVTQLQRQVAEQERQIRQLEVENARLRYMLTEADTHSGDPLYGTRVSGKPGGGVDSKPELGEVHVVVEGDTLSQIAAARGVDLEALAQLNRLADPSSIRPGQRLRLPESTRPPTPRAKPDEKQRMAELPAPKPHFHTIRSGENLYRVSLRYRVDLEDLLASNPSLDPHALRIGQQVRIPGSGPMLAGGG